jgi:hypothetical protein
MSFTRLQYDTCEYKQELSDNVTVLGYVLDPVKYNHCTPCRSELGLVGGNNVSQVTANIVDLENDLFGINRGNSRCAMTRFMPRNDNKVQGRDLWKDTKFPIVDTTPKHLQSCQYFDLPSVPVSPAMQPFTCSRK